MAGVRAGRPRRRVTRVADVAGVVPTILDRLELAVGAPGPPPDEVHVGILRPLDLVVLDVRGVGLRIDATAPQGPALVHTSDNAAQLIVTLPFQHLGEQSWLEELGSIPATTLADHRAARPSRVVFDVPVGTTIPFSSQGILTAMRTLALRVVPAAQQRPVPTRPRLGDLSDVLLLPGGMVFGRHGGNLVLTRTRASALDTSLRNVLAMSTTMRHVRLRLGDGVAMYAGPAVDRVGAEWVVPWFVPRPRARQVRVPHADETAIEAPWRVILSPSALEGFTHADDPVPALDDAAHIELWHSRLGVRVVDAQSALVRVDEGPSPQRIVRAVWNRDRELMAVPPVVDSLEDRAPVRTSLGVNHRWAFVRQSAETVRGHGNTTITPTPIEAERLTLSSLGTSLAVHGKWEILPYTTAGLTAYISWDHIAPLGRDQFVKVVRPGYLSSGHRWTWVEQTERLIEDVVDPVARLRTKFYMEAIDDILTFENNDLPFASIRVRPLHTPSLRSSATSNPASADGNMIWPTLLSGEPFLFAIETVDRAGEMRRLNAPLLWIAAELVDVQSPDGAAIDKLYRTTFDRHVIAADGQRIAYAPPNAPGDTSFETTKIHLRATVTHGKITPRLLAAEVVSPTARALTPQAAGFVMRYRADYITNGFAANPASGDPQLFADVVDITKASLIGHGAPAVPLVDAVPASFPGITFPSTERSGGFVKPDQESSRRPLPSGVWSMAMLAWLPSRPTAVSVHSPLTVSRPTTVRPNSVKKAIVASMSRTAIPTFSSLMGMR